MSYLDRNGGIWGLNVENASSSRTKTTISWCFVNKHGSAHQPRCFHSFETTIVKLASSTPFSREFVNDGASKTPQKPVNLTFLLYLATGTKNWVKINRFKLDRCRHTLLVRTTPPCIQQWRHSVVQFKISNFFDWKTYQNK